VNRVLPLFLHAALCFSQTGEKPAPYLPTPHKIVQRMLQLAELKPGEKMFDLGSGDGRIVILAARKFKADATGIEYDKKLFEDSSAAIRKQRLVKTARIIYGDLFQQDYTSADVITVYLLPASNGKLMPILETQLKKGTRIVAHDFGFAGWEPTKTEVIEDDVDGRSHTLFLYIR
jgi:protein-L-isoaspartate O-methyltransferase